MKKNKRNNTQTPKIAFVFQGGGALGAYQVGVFTALCEAGYQPDWLVGTSIGAINSAIIAGNAPEHRIEQLHQFWDKISRTLPSDGLADGNDWYRTWHNYLSAQSALYFGQPGFFHPRLVSPIVSSMLHDAKTPDTISFYDTQELRCTLEAFIDFDRINHQSIRLSLGSVEITHGHISYFDSRKQKIGPEHIMASGALPPGFPAVEVDGKMYWDGGISSNTPVSQVLLEKSTQNVLCFMIHLFNSYGLLPTNLDEVMKRKKDITFSSNYHHLIDYQREIHRLRCIIHCLGKEVPATKKEQKTIKRLLSKGTTRKVDLVRFHYDGKKTDLASKDYEFSKSSIQTHIACGYADAAHALTKSPWQTPIPDDMGIAVHEMTDMKLNEENYRETE